MTVSNNEIKSKDQIHYIVKKKKLKPKYCEICNEYKKKLYLASIDHTYTLFPKDYMYLCGSCHFLYDKIRQLRTFTKNQKEYTWKIIKSLKLDVIKDYYIVNKEKVFTTLHKSALSKSWYYRFKMNEKYFKKKGLKIDKENKPIYKIIDCFWCRKHLRTHTLYIYKKHLFCSSKCMRQFAHIILIQKYSEYYYSQAFTIAEKKFMIIEKGFYQEQLI